MDKFKDNVDHTIKEMKRIQDCYAHLYSSWEGILLGSIQNNMQYIDDKGSLVAFLTDPNPKIRALAQEEMVRRERLRSEQRAWYRKIFDRVRGKLPVSVLPSGQSKKAGRTAKRDL